MKPPRWLIVVCVAGLLGAAAWWVEGAKGPPEALIVPVEWNTFTIPRVPPGVTLSPHNRTWTGDGYLWLWYQRRSMTGRPLYFLGYVHAAGHTMKPVASWAFPGEIPAGYLADGGEAVLAGLDAKAKSLLLHWTTREHNLQIPLPQLSLAASSRVGAQILWFPDARPDSFTGVLMVKPLNSSGAPHQLWWFTADAVQLSGRAESWGQLQDGLSLSVHLEPSTGIRTIQAFNRLHGKLEHGVRLSREGTVVEVLPAPAPAPRISPRGQGMQSHLQIADLVFRYEYQQPLYLPVPYLSHYVARIRPAETLLRITTCRIRQGQLEELPGADPSGVFSRSQLFRSQVWQHPDQSHLLAILLKKPRRNKEYKSASHLAVGYLGADAQEWKWAILPMPPGYDIDAAGVFPPRAELHDGQVRVHFWAGRQKTKQTLHTAALDPWWGP